MVPLARTKKNKEIDEERERNKERDTPARISAASGEFFRWAVFGESPVGWGGGGGGSGAVRERKSVRLCVYF